jgi:hypothetical protein
MSKLSVLSLAKRLSSNLADDQQIERYYDEVVLDLGKLPILVKATIIAVGPDASGPPYDLPEEVIEPLQWYYDDTMLPVATSLELQQFNLDHQALKGKPLVVDLDMEQSTRQFSLVPDPTVPSEAPNFFFGRPFGVDYPHHAVVLIHTENKAHVPRWLELPVALFILAREFSRESNHTDLAFAAQCARLAQALMRMVE